MFLKHATSDQIDKTFLLLLSPKFASPCCGTIYMHGKMQKKSYKIMRQTGLSGNGSK